MKRQVIAIHGGDWRTTPKEFLAELKNEEVDADDFKLRTGWKQSLQQELGKAFEVFNPSMPSAGNATYLEWKIWFEKMIPFIHDGAVFVGHSLGGIFLARYFSENIFPKKVEAIFLVAAPYKDRKKGKPSYCGGFSLKNDLSLIEEQVEKVYLYHSKDDQVVPFGHMKKFQGKIPGADIGIFTDRGHFNQKKFPELVKAIKALW